MQLGDYRKNGWHPHSGAGPNSDKWWLAEYRNGGRVSTLDRSDGRLILFSTWQGARRRADELNT